MLTTWEKSQKLTRLEHHRTGNGKHAGHHFSRSLERVKSFVIHSTRLMRVFWRPFLWWRSTFRVTKRHVTATLKLVQPAAPPWKVRTWLPSILFLQYLETSYSLILVSPVFLAEENRKRQDNLAKPASEAVNNGWNSSTINYTWESVKKRGLKFFETWNIFQR